MFLLQDMDRPSRNMSSKHNSSAVRTRSPWSIFFVVCLCLFFYAVGTRQNPCIENADRTALEITRTADRNQLKVNQETKNLNEANPNRGNLDGEDSNSRNLVDSDLHHENVNQETENVGDEYLNSGNLEFGSHRDMDNEIVEPSRTKGVSFEPCDVKYTDYTPCHEQNRAMKFPREKMIYRERHCPPAEEKLRCLIPAPKGYSTPFLWPKGRDFVHYANVPHKSLTVKKAVQNWVEFQGDVFRFPGGGTMFPHGADAYIDELATVIPIGNGSIRTALDTGCGVASWGAYLMQRNVLTMSFAPRDNHEAQVQFALERGVPAIIGVLGTIHLPYPSRSFDMVQCSRCLIHWAENEGMYLMEVDRVLRPGGYWILSGPPINWKTYYKTWKLTRVDVQAEQRKVEELAESLCWDKMYEKGDIAIWRKNVNDKECQRGSVNLCKSNNADDVWYKEMEPCVTPFPEVDSEDEVAGGELKAFPKRVYAVPPRISSGLIEGVTAESYAEDNELWRRRVISYKRLDGMIGTARYRNVMDMNAGLGGFAATLESSNSWVMNVVPSTAKNTLGAIYERGLIGIYHDWCEAFSTYPRTYDFIHADGVFSMHRNMCDMEDILLEMDRILRPEGAILIRDNFDVINEVRRITGGMRWDTRLMRHEDGPLVAHNILVAKKQ